MERHRLAKETYGELASEIETESSLGKDTHIVYLQAILSYSDIATEVWKLLYSAQSSSHQNMQDSAGLLDAMIDGAKNQLPSRLLYKENIPFEDMFAGMSWPNIKQCIILHLVRTTHDSGHSTAHDLSWSDLVALHHLETAHPTSRLLPQE
jgi:hypothetical protein